jgi:hypothetical protein
MRGQKEDVAVNCPMCRTLLACEYMNDYYKLKRLGTKLGFVVSP